MAQPYINLLIVMIPRSRSSFFWVRNLGACWRNTHVERALSGMFALGMDRSFHRPIFQPELRSGSNGGSLGTTSHTTLASVVFLVARLRRMPLMLVSMIADIRMLFQPKNSIMTEAGRTASRRRFKPYCGRMKSGTPSITSRHAAGERADGTRKRCRTTIRRCPAHQGMILVDDGASYVGIVAREIYCAPWSSSAGTVTVLDAGYVTIVTLSRLRLLRGVGRKYSP